MSYRKNPDFIEKIFNKKYKTYEKQNFLILLGLISVFFMTWYNLTINISFKPAYFIIKSLMCFACVSFVGMGIDKVISLYNSTGHNFARIRNNVLLLLCILGGGWSTWLAQRIFKHKLAYNDDQNKNYKIKFARAENVGLCLWGGLILILLIWWMLA